MPGKTDQKKPFFGSKFILIVALVIICASAYFFSNFIKDVSSIYSLVFISLLLLSILASICFIVLVISKLIQHEIENYYESQREQRD